MLEPRRIAARAVAERMAWLLDEEVGQTVGYRIRRESKVTAATRIEVLTEGILTRMLIDDPTLDGVDLIIFDEFHERSLYSDEALALTREVQNILRPDLKILIMSATIDAEQICRSLNAPLMDCPGRLYDVTVIREEEATRENCAQAVAHVARRALREQEGDILAFLPGQRDIEQAMELLANISAAQVMPLYGGLSSADQKRAIAGSRAGERRIVLATSIAETSLTIEGVRVVIDSGWHRKPVFDPRTGMSRLETVRISRDMATQRMGRAGRVNTGTCYQLWSLATDHAMQENRTPELLEADLSPLLLDTKSFGADGLGENLPWLTTPPHGKLLQAQDLLTNLGALDENGQMTDTGRKMAKEGAHPRIARMLAEADSADQRRLAEKIAEAIEDRTYMPATCEAGMLVARAYPERIGRYLGNGKYRLASGDEVLMDSSCPLLGREWIAVATLNGKHIGLAAPLEQQDIPTRQRDTITWRDEGLIAQREKRAGVHIVESKPIHNLPRETITSHICDAVSKAGRQLLNWSEAMEQLQHRVALVAQWHPELGLPDMSEEAILSATHDWLPFALGRATTTAELKKIPLEEATLCLLTYDQQQALARYAPTHVTVPTGSKIRIDYRAEASAPVLSVRLQECFGMTDTPRINEGKQLLLMELLSPGYKPVQLTQDLASFWMHTYFEVRKELKRRYPKHYWPDDPMEAEAVRGVKS